MNENTNPGNPMVTNVMNGTTVPSSVGVWQAMVVASRVPATGETPRLDEQRVGIPLDAETALRGLLHAGPHVEPVDD